MPKVAYFYLQFVFSNKMERGWELLRQENQR